MRLFTAPRCFSAREAVMLEDALIPNVQDARGLVRKLHLSGDVASVQQLRPVLDDGEHVGKIAESPRLLIKPLTFRLLVRLRCRLFLGDVIVLHAADLPTRHSLRNPGRLCGPTDCSVRPTSKKTDGWWR